MWIKHPNNRIAVYVPDSPKQGRAEFQATEPAKKTGKKSSKKS